MTTCEVIAPVRVQTRRPATSPAPAKAATGRHRPLARVELALLALLYVAYSVARLLGNAELGPAVDHARDLLRLESLLGMDIELAANKALHSVPFAPIAASYWYSLLHYVVTPAVLFWAYRARPTHYRRVRNALVIGSAVGLVGFTLLPMAPPRMLSGYVDTLAATSDYGWWGSDASAPKGLGALTNELAAMPSLHVGWAFWVAWVVLTLTRGRVARALAVFYVVGTVLVVVATANHYVLDAVAGIAVLVLGMALAGRRAGAAGRRAPAAVRLAESIPDPLIPAQRRRDQAEPVTAATSAPQPASDEAPRPGPVPACPGEHRLWLSQRPDLGHCGGGRVCTRCHQDRLLRLRLRAPRRHCTLPRDGGRQCVSSRPR